MNESITQILLVLLDRPGSAASILDAIAALDGGREPSLATFYRQLARASDSGWVEVVESKETQLGPGRPRQSYRITAAGRARVRQEAERLQRLAQAALAADAGE